MTTLPRRRMLVLLCVGLWAASVGLPSTAAETATPTPKEPRRIISMAPSITEILFAIGAGDLLIGTSDFTTWPPEATRLKRVGGWSNPNYEVISSLQPDLLLIQGRHQKVRDYAAQRKLPLDGVTMESFSSVRDGIMHLGKLTGHTTASAALVERIDVELRQLAEALPAHESWPKVFVCLGRQPGSLNDLTTANQGSFLDDALRAGGGINLFGDLKQPYPQISKEALIARKPDVIIEIRSDDEIKQAKAEAMIADWQALAMLPAVRNNRVYVLSGDYLLVPGPRLTQAVRAIARSLHVAAPAPDATQ